MPLLTSPIDGSPMRQINRYGIEIDVCTASGGIWLDKGELEKLMAMIKEDTINEHTPASYSAGHYSKKKHYDDDYGDDDNDYYDKQYRHRGKKSKFSRIADIFDF